MSLRRLSCVAAGLAAFAACAVTAAPHKPAKPPAATTPAASDWRTPDPQDVLVIETNKGRIIVELAPRIAPATAARIRDLARQKFYDGQSFFRVIDDFMDQTGDPLNTGTGGSALPNLEPEFGFRRGSDMPFTLVDHLDGQDSGFVGSMPVISQPLALAVLMADARVKAYGTFCSGVAGMARAEAPGSGNSQFFLMRGPRLELDQKYTPFGRVIAGEDVVRAIKTGEPPEAPADKMLTVPSGAGDRYREPLGRGLSGALPGGARPVVHHMRPRPTLGRRRPEVTSLALRSAA
jgi:peptidylprolyl isomerase